MLFAPLTLVIMFTLQAVLAINESKEKVFDLNLQINQDKKSSFLDKMQEEREIYLEQLFEMEPTTELPRARRVKRN